MAYGHDGYATITTSTTETYFGQPLTASGTTTYGWGPQPVYGQSTPIYRPWEPSEKLVEQARCLVALEGPIASEEVAEALGLPISRVVDTLHKAGLRYVRHLGWIVRK